MPTPHDTPPPAPQRKQAAADPATPPDQLARLAADGNLHVRRVAAQNPSTPADTLDLLQRAGSTPDLAGLTRPDGTLDADALAGVARLGEWGRRLAARHPHTSRQTLGELSCDPIESIRRAVAENPAADARALTPLCADRSAAVRQAAMQHNHAPRDVIDRLNATRDKQHIEPDVLQTLAAAGPWARQLVAAHPSCPADLLRELAYGDDWHVRAAVVDNPAADAATLAGLIRLDDPAARAALAGHPNTSGDTLRRLADDEHVSVWLALAGNPHTPGDVLARLAASGASEARTRAAANPSMPSEALAQLVAAGSTPDLTGFAEPDPALDPDVLTQLAGAGGWGRQLAARHPCTPHGTLAQLATDTDPMTREIVSRHPNPPADLIGLLVRAGSSEDLMGYGRPGHGITHDELDRLMSMGSWARRLAARHARATPDRLTALARDEDAQVRRAVAQHPDAPGGAVRALAQDTTPDIRWAVANRADLSADTLRTLATDTIPTIRQRVARHPDAPREVLAQLALDLDQDVRTTARNRGAENSK